MTTTFTMGMALRLALAAGVVAIGGGCGATPTAAHPNAQGERAGVGDASDASGDVMAEDDPNAQAVTSTIKRVTVYSDRALVSREAAVQVATAPTVFVFDQLPGWVDDGSVRAATTTGRIVDVRVTRSYLARATEKSYREAEARARAVADQLAGLDDELAVLAAESKQVEDIKAFSLDRINKELAAGAPPGSAASASTGPVGVATYASVVDFIAEKLRDIAKRRRAVQSAREKLAPEVEATAHRLEDLRGLTQVEQTKVYVTVSSPTAGAGQLQLSYMIPGATWEAAHELRAGDGEPTPAEWTSFAVVTQASGEDWDHAELTFSTQSSTASVRIPELQALALGDTRAGAQTIERQSASFRRAESAFKAQNRLWNQRVQGTQGSSFEESYQSNFEHLQIAQSKTVQIFQSLQQRGTTSQFKAIGATKVRADGHSVRVPIGRAALQAKRAIVAAPEQSLNAAQTLKMVNEGGQSLLPGGVALYQAGAFLGMTDVDFVADGEPFAVFLSVADQLKISRTLDKKRSALVRKQRTQMQLAFIVTVENLANKATSLDLADRIPVSEDKDVVISGVKISPDVKADSKGILHWPVTLQPKEKRRFEIQYQVEYPPTLVLEMKRNAASPPSPAAPAGAPAAAPKGGYDIKKDLEQYENAL